MTGRRDRVFKTIQGEATDRPPKGELLIEEELIKKLGLSSLIDVAETLDLDILTLEIKEEPDWIYYKDHDFFTVGLYQGPFTSIFQNHSLQQLSKLIIRTPQVAEKMMADDILNSRSLLFKALKEGVDAVLIADDIAGQSGPLVSPRFLEEHYFPLLKKLIMEIRDEGYNVPVLFHSDGNLTSILTLLKEAGFNGLQCLEASSGMSPVLFAYGGFEGWLFWGNFEFEDNEKMKSPLDIAMEIPRLLYRWQDIGGYIFGSTGGLYGGLDPQAVLTAYRVVDKGYKKSI